MKTLRSSLMMTLTALLAVGAFAILTAFDGRQSLKIQKASSSMSISGTSSLHDWTVAVNDFACDLTVVSDLSLLKIEAVTYRGKAKSIKSDNSTMDKKIYEALKTDKHPDIRYTVRSSRDVSVKDKKFNGLITGDIQLAGKTRSETIHFTGQMLSADRLQIKGSKKLKMSDFGIDPPTALLGTVRTGNEVTVTFTLLLAVSN